MFKRASLLALGLILLCGLAQASTPPTAAPAPSVPDIVSQQQSLRSKVIAREGAFKDISDSEREQLIKHQTRLLELLQGQTDLEQLNADLRIEVFNTLEMVKAAVNKAEDERRICERVKAVGSNRVQMVCMTARQKREYEDAARRNLGERQACKDCMIMED